MANRALEMRTSILVIENDETDISYWGRLSKKYNIGIEVYPSMNEAFVAWCILYAQDRIPRVFIMDYRLDIGSHFPQHIPMPDGSDMSMEGPESIMWLAITAVHNDCGMFVAFTQEPYLWNKAIENWPSYMRNRVHVKSKKEFSCSELLDYIQSHSDYTTQKSKLESLNNQIK